MYAYVMIRCPVRFLLSFGRVCGRLETIPGVSGIGGGSLPGSAVSLSVWQIGRSLSQPASQPWGMSDAAR